jgi:hypothetical protein
MTALSSTQYTIGTALERAREGGSNVEVLVDSHWLSGQVVATDGLGVVLDHNGEEHCVVRLERVAAVRVAAEAPTLSPVPAGPSFAGQQTYDGVVSAPVTAGLRVMEG